MTERGTSQQRRNLAHLLLAWRSARRDRGNVGIGHELDQIEGGVDGRTWDRMVWENLRAGGREIPPDVKEQTPW